MLAEVVLLLLALTLIYLALRKPPGLPPGVWGLPILGKFPSSTVRFGDQVKALRPQYGDIITWRVGSRVMVFLCNYNLIKRALNKPELADRPDFSTFVHYSQGELRGVIFSNGIKWQMQRRFVLRHLRNLGMGKSKVEQDIQEEANLLVQDFKKHTGKSEPLPETLGLVPLNVLWKMVADARLDLDDPKAHELIRLVWSINDTFQGSITLINFFPWIDTYAPCWVKNMLGLRRLEEICGRLYSFAKRAAQEHENFPDSHNENDLINQYLSAMKEDDDQGSVFTLEDLYVMAMDLFLAGTETTSSTIRWTILYLAKYPEIQQRVQQEIDSVVPKGTLPQYQDRSKMPYFEAVLSEVHRIVSLVPLAVPHMASQDTQLEGYTIPKGTLIMPHIECCHKDPQLWEKPDQFYPEHFLDSDGKYVSREGLMPFSVGRRVCLGESLARVELFVFLVALLQNFTFIRPDGEPLSTENDPKEIAVNAPKPFRITITERQ